MSARREFWLDLSERAAKTAAQAAAGVLAGTTVLAIDWKQAALIVGTAVLASLLTSLGSAQIGDADTASVIRRPPSLGDVGRTLGVPDVGLRPPERAIPGVNVLIDAALAETPNAPEVLEVLEAALAETPNVVRTVESATSAWEKALRGDR